MTTDTGKVSHLQGQALTEPVQSEVVSPEHMRKLIGLSRL